MDGSNILFSRINTFLLFSLVSIIHDVCSGTMNMQIDTLPDCIEQSIVNNFLLTNIGKTSHYGTKFHKKKTASGEQFDLFAHSAAHRSLPFGTIVKVINTKNNYATLVKINDRGPFIKDRIIDLSPKAAKMIDGWNNPNVILQFFDNTKILENIDSTYFLGYSIFEPFIIVNRNAINITDSIDNFEGAMNLYLNADSLYTTSKYIFIKTKQISKQQQYFIGNFHSIKN